jgi:hypothetical protein
MIFMFAPFLIKKWPLRIKLFPRIGNSLATFSWMARLLLPLFNPFFWTSDTRIEQGWLIRGYNRNKRETCVMQVKIEGFRSTCKGPLAVPIRTDRFAEYLRQWADGLELNGV